MSAFEHGDDNLKHGPWLSMMLPRPRPQRLREFLREDSSMGVTTDDHEGPCLKVSMDEVFGRTHFVARIVWRRSYAGFGDAKNVVEAVVHAIESRGCGATAASGGGV